MALDKRQAQNSELDKTTCDGRVPFILGISGHRFLNSREDESLLFEQITSTISYWHNVLNKKTPIWILSGLAQGADLIAVNAALTAQQKLGSRAIKILATLPMDKSAFAQDFDVESDALLVFNDTYKKLQTNNNKIIVLKNELSDAQNKAAIADKQFGELRNSLYLNQSLFIAKYSNVLLAIWDGHESHGSGGTADAVYYKLGRDVAWPSNTGNSALEPVSEFDGQVGGLVHHLPMQNHKSSLVPIQPKNLVVFVDPLLHVPAPDIGILYSYSEYPSVKAATLGGFITHEFIELIVELKTHNSDSSTASTNDCDSMPVARDIFKSADALAENFQAKYRRIIRLFFLIILPGFVTYEIAGSYNNDLIGAAILSLILLVLLACWFLIKRSQKLNYKWRYQLARGVAEGIRIRQSLNAANVAPSPEPLIPRKFRTNLPLINHAISIAEIAWWDKQYESAPQKTKEQWLAPQIGFLSSRLSKNSTSFSQLVYKRPLLAAQKCNSLAKGFLYTAIVTGLLLLISIVGNQLLNNAILSKINELLMFVIQYSVVLGGLISLWAELAGYNSTAMGYKSLKSLYIRASVLIDKNNHSENSSILLDLAREAMVEHITWNLAEVDNDIKQK